MRTGGLASQFSTDRMEASGRLIKPWRLALIIAGAFLVITVPYILISGQIAATLSANVLALEEIERIKGLLFVATTTVMLFGLCYLLFRRVARRELELVKYRNALLASERRAAAGLFASSVAHDMNNVLTIVEYATHSLGRHDINKDADILKDLERANEDLKKLSRLLMRASGRHLSESVAEFDLAAAVRETAGLARTHMKVTRCALTVEAPGVLLLCGISVVVRQMLLNLIINAADATKHRGRIAVKLIVSETGAIISVCDNGPGIPDDQRDTILEPFVTTKTDGSGLGLLSVKVCADEHQGRVEIERSEMGGACFRVHLKSQQFRKNSPAQAPSAAQPKPNEFIPAR